jgi:hypothetical protein
VVLVLPRRFTPALIEAAQMLADAYEAASPFPSVAQGC